jgi:hypothetical protein
MVWLKKYAVLLFACVALSCHGQTKNTYQFQLSIAPSFCNKSVFVIERDHSNGYVKFFLYESYDNQPIVQETGIMKNDDEESFLNVIKGYDFQIQLDNDTIAVEKYVERGDTLLAYVVTERLDGLRVNGHFQSENYKRQFAFLSLEKQNAHLVETVLKIAEKYFSDERSIRYLQDLRECIQKR